MNITFPLILDGAMGTQLLRNGMPNGACPEQWIMENPDVAYEIQKSYVDAGSQVLYTPTFGGNAACLEKHGIINKVEEYNLALAGISKKASSGKALVAGDISSTGGVLYPLGDISFDDFYEIYLEQATALEKAGVDLFVIETMTSVFEARAAILAVKAISSKPVFVSFSCDESGRTMMGTDVCAALQIMQGMGADAFGLNCSSGPGEILKQIKRLHEYSSIPLIAKPNAGLPHVLDGKTEYSINAKQFAEYIPSLSEAGVCIFGACCGSDRSYIAEIKKAIDSISVKTPSPQYLDLLPCATEKDVFMLDSDQTVEHVFACDDDLEDNLFELEGGELFRIKITSLEDIALFSDIQYAIRNPLCIICDDAEILEKTLRAYQGRALYDGALSDSVLMPLVKKYGLIIR